ncbi:hypothetical protein JCM30471_12090 [Desulfuromonas carbonis]|uniref:hypothetical protein n=1 Tax=Desulfuromonas sp. DDH964 TaxID=1823759 RepID=UPI00078C8369|nr:hypothetical protein [Desulfuromonas sp. DDH964]AMV72693.1 hypothetical protein DBW_2356 [Desulfuromonas sp. DDH964]
MSFGFWVVVAAGGVGGYLAFRRLREMETEIRGEIAGRQEKPKKDEVSAREPALPSGGGSEPVAVTLDNQVLSLIRTRPGRLQTDIYREMSQVDRKTLQELLLRLDRGGLVRRVKEGSTYKLFPA